jgi:outer membrane protein TolC
MSHPIRVRHISTIQKTDIVPNHEISAAQTETTAYKSLQEETCLASSNGYNASTKFGFSLMSVHLKPPVPVTPCWLSTGKPATGWLLCCALICSGPVIAAETSDPFSTDEKLTHKPALYSGDPCAKSDQPLDLYGVVNIALCNNPQTREVWANSRAQAAQVGVNRAGYLPSISVSLAQNRNSPGNSQRSIGLGLTYLLYDFGARAANLENARQTLISVNATQDNTVQTLFLAAVQAYYQTRATQAAFEASTVSELAARESFAAARARYSTGSATPADKLTAQTAYSQATLNRITADGAMKIARGNLSNMLGLDANIGVLLVAAQATPDETTSHSTKPAGGQVAAYLPRAGEGANDLSPDGEGMKIFEQNIATLIIQARKNRPDLRAAEATVKAAEATADAARAAAKPTLTMTASTNQNNSAGITTQGSTLGLNITAPLFSGFAPTYRIRAAEAQIETRQAQLDRIRLQVALDVWTAYQNLLTATQNRRTTADLLKSAQQSERVALGRYKAGAGIMLDLLNAQTTLAGARQQRIQADLNWNIGRATLAQAMGTLDAGLLQELPDSVLNTDSSPTK